jgi:UDP-N-acetylglucosamine--N-acetylmuramyl-(pentapeptide) pyrophosphoryl-undecaprenol N-acetylglucosamine transferase
MSVVFSGGGTGGHLYPALALAEGLRALRPDLRVVFLGARRGVEARVLPDRGEEHHLLPIRGLDRTGGLAGNLGVPWAVASSLGSVLALFRRLRPELVVVTGGYAGAPAGIVAAALGIPLALQEQNAVPGMTTRLLASRAAQIHLAYPEATERLSTAARARVRLSGNPVTPPSPRDPSEARAVFDLDPGRTTVLVVGGSQGSAALNQGTLQMIRAASLDGPPPYQILWSTGPRHHPEVRRELERSGDPHWVRDVPYIDDMPSALAAADVAVSRAGAMATSEFLAWGMPAILVPLPTAAADHQTRNAEALAEAGCAIHVPEADFQGKDVARRLSELLRDDAALSRMSRAARERGRPHAAREIAAALQELLPDDGGGA